MRVTPLAYVLATLAQFVMGVFIFGTGYAVVLYLLRLPADVWICAAIGAVHGVAVGLFLPVVARYDPGVRSGRTQDPGLFAVNFGWIAPPGLVGAHVVYGIVYGLLYAGGRQFILADAWLAGLLGTVALTLFVLAGRVLGLTAIGTLDMIAASVQEVLNRRGMSGSQRAAPA